jgi:hypothetical protein
MPATRETRSTIESALVVDAALARPAGVTVRELCEQLGGCHPKTVRRRLAWLRLTFGVRIRLVGGFGLDKRYVYPHGECGVFSKAVRPALR